MRGLETCGKDSTVQEASRQRSRFMSHDIQSESQQCKPLDWRGRPHLSHFPSTNPIQPSGSAGFDHLMPLKKNSYIKETALLLSFSHYIKLQSLLFTLALHISVAGLGGERMERGEL
jgi:hypothetical protein